MFLKQIKILRLFIDWFWVYAVVSFCFDLPNSVRADNCVESVRKHYSAIDKLSFVIHSRLFAQLLKFEAAVITLILRLTFLYL